MKTVLPIILALATQVSASPVEGSSIEVASQGVLFEGEELLLNEPGAQGVFAMQFLGPITPGGPDVALSGTAKEIYEQILKLNPAYDVFDFPAYAEDLESQGITRENLDSPNPEVFSRNPAVAARDVLAKRDNINCDIGTWVGNVHTQCTEGLAYLRRLGQAWCGAPAHSYARVSCSWNCGMYLYSKLNKTKNVRCNSIANDIQKIVYECGVDYNGWVLEARGRLAFASHNTELWAANC